MSVYCTKIAWPRFLHYQRLFNFFFTDMVFHVWTSREKDNSTNFLILITQLFQRINSKRFGTEVTYEFVELLGCFIKVSDFHENKKYILLRILKLISKYMKSYF